MVFEAGTAEAWKGDIIRAGRHVRPASPIDTPVRISVALFLPRPKRLMRRGDPDGPVWCPAKPDRDNAEKAVLDALKADGWLRDDCIVVDGPVRKLYHAKDGVPGAVITIECAGAVPACLEQQARELARGQLLEPDGGM